MKEVLQGRALLSKQLQQVAFHHNEWCADVEAGIQVERILNPDFWAHVATKLKRGDIIRVIPQDMSWFAELLVAGSTKVAAHVIPLRIQDLTEKKSKIASDDDTGNALYFTKWRGPRALWCVLRRSDNAVLAEKLGSKDMAAQWISDFEKGIVAAA